MSIRELIAELLEIGDIDKEIELRVGGITLRIDRVFSFGQTSHVIDSVEDEDYVADNAGGWVRESSL